MGSRADLESLLGREVNAFAYPYGKWSDVVRSAVAGAGYCCAFSTRSGFSHLGDDPMLVRRIDVEGTDTARSLLRKVRFGTNDGSLFHAGRYYFRRALGRVGFEAP
jgi:hypothetical protein